jgi:hypothetical protein
MVSRQWRALRMIYEKRSTIDDGDKQRHKWTKGPVHVFRVRSLLQGRRRRRRRRTQCAVVRRSNDGECRQFAKLGTRFEPDLRS